MNNSEKYFTAKEAREMSEAVSNEKMYQELDSIYEKINSARLRGEVKITIPKFFMNPTIEFLKAKGFKIDIFTGDQRDPANDTIISW